MWRPPLGPSRRGAAAARRVPPARHPCTRRDRAGPRRASVNAGRLARHVLPSSRSSTWRDGRPFLLEIGRAAAGLAAGVLIVEVVSTLDARPFQARGIGSAEPRHDAALGATLLQVRRARRMTRPLPCQSTAARAWSVLPCLPDRSFVDGPLFWVVEAPRVKLQCPFKRRHGLNVPI